MLVPLHPSAHTLVGSASSDTVAAFSSGALVTPTPNRGATTSGAADAHTRFIVRVDICLGRSQLALIASIATPTSSKSPVTMSRDNEILSSRQDAREYTVRTLRGAQHRSGPLEGVHLPTTAGLNIASFRRHCRGADESDRQCQDVSFLGVLYLPLPEISWLTEPFRVFNG